MIEMGRDAVRQMGAHWTLNRCYTNSSIDKHSSYNLYKQVPAFFHKMHTKPYAFISVDERPYSSFQMLFNYQADSIEQALLLKIDDVIQYFTDFIERYTNDLNKAERDLAKESRVLFRWLVDLTEFQTAVDQCREDLAILEKGLQDAQEVKAKMLAIMPADIEDMELWIQQFVDKCLFESTVRVFIYDYLSIHKLPDKVRIEGKNYHQTPVSILNLNKLNRLFHDEIEEPLIEPGHIVLSGLYDVQYSWMIDGRTRVMTVGCPTYSLYSDKDEATVCTLDTSSEHRPFRHMSQLHGILIFKDEAEATAYLAEKLDRVMRNIKKVQGEPDAT